MSTDTAITPAYGSAAWVEERRQYIGASDVGAVLGLDPYRSPLDVWAQKTGRAEEGPLSQAAKMGHLLEPVVCTLAEQQYRETVATGTVQLVPSETLTGRAPWQRATPDRVVNVLSGELPLESWLLEAKTKTWHTARDFGEPGTDQVPDAILLQVLWQMDVTMLSRCDVAVLVDGRDFHLYTVRYEPTLANDVFDRVADWWQRYVVADVEPPVSRATDVEYLRRKFSQHGADLLPATPEVETAVAALAEARRAAKAAEEREALAKARVMELLGDAKGVHTSTGKVSWSLVKGRTSTNWQAIAETMGAPLELIAQHTTIGAPSRQFRFTSPKE